MKTKPFVQHLKIPVTGKIGSVSAILTRPSSCKVVLTLAHSAGSDMHNSYLERLSLAYADYDIATLRFNFPYREAGKKMPDRYPVATASVHAVVNEAVTLFQNVPVVCAGKSFGGRMSSLMYSLYAPASVRALIMFGFPLHPADMPSVERAEHLEKVGIPMLFIQGSKDKLAYMDLMNQVCEKLPLATLHPIEGADHSLSRGQQSGIETLAQRSAQWLDEVLLANSG